MHDKLSGPCFFSENIVTGLSYFNMLELYVLPNCHLKLSCNMMERRHIAAIMLGITWTERWLVDGSAEVDQSLGLLGRQI
jgi:hypothetical protein